MERTYISLDIETCTAESCDHIACEGNGLNPTIAAITSVGIWIEGQDEGIAFMLEDYNDEYQLLLIVNQAMEMFNSVEGATLVTYNGSNFDLPFLRTRMNILGVSNSIAVQTNHPDRKAFYGDTLGDVLIKWGGIVDHLDIAYPFKAEAKWQGRKGGLKQVFPHHFPGEAIIEVDRENMHLLTRQEEEDYVLSDVNATLKLALKFKNVSKMFSDSQTLIQDGIRYAK